MTPILGIFNPIGSLFYMSTQFESLSLSAETIRLSLSHIVLKILGPKVGLGFCQNVLFDRF